MNALLARTLHFTFVSSLVSGLYVAAQPQELAPRIYSRAGADVIVPGSSAHARVPVTIRRLSPEEVPPLNPGLLNVTPEGAAYRLGPDGQTFDVPVQVRLPFDPELLPAESAAADIETYYFEEASESWIPVDTIEVDTANHRVTGETTHFTDFISGLLVTPDHPELAAFAPTQIKDLAAASPAAGIHLIEPPEVSPLGEASLGMPLEVPPGRNGMQPDLALRYDSSGGNGWVGLGWELTLPVVSIDTRWGVPHYDEAMETETYLLDGLQLTPVSNRGPLVERRADRVFHTRVEGEFRRIQRHGDSPRNYYWEVTRKDGVRMLYGGTAAEGADPEARLVDDCGNVAMWALREVRDPNDNLVKYHYEEVVDTGVQGSSVRGRTIYPKRITYTGRRDVEGEYTVTFVRDDELAEPRRADVMMDGRGGFKKVTACLLRRIEVAVAADPVRTYELQYEEGRFGKSLLTSIVQLGADGDEFYRHDLEYFDDLADLGPDEVQGFEGPATFTAAASASQSALDGSDSDISQFDFFAGVGEQCKASSEGIKLGADSLDDVRNRLLVDVDGDLLLDQVYERGGSFFYRPNLSRPGPDFTSVGGFGAELPLPTLPGLDTELSTTATAGTQDFKLAGIALKEFSQTRTRGVTFLSDVNGDLLTDVSVDGTVYFNDVSSGVPVFAPGSPTPLEDDSPSDTGGMVFDPEALKAEMVEAFHPIDPLLRWVAPFAGEIRITAKVSLVAPHDTVDGVVVSVQKNDDVLVTLDLGAGDDTTHTIDRTVSVRRDDRLYFRVNSLEDGTFDAVDFDPRIEYETVIARRPRRAPLAPLSAAPSGIDENGFPTLVYRASTDFAFGTRETSWTSPADGEIDFHVVLTKDDFTSDNLELRVFHEDTLVDSEPIAWDATGSFEVEGSFEVDTEDEVRLELHTDSRISYAGIELAPEFTLVPTVTARASGHGFGDVPGTSPPDGSVTFCPPPSIRIYPFGAREYPYFPWMAPADGEATFTIEVAAGAVVDPSLNTELHLAVKRQDELLGKGTVRIVNGVLDGASSVAVTAMVQAGDEVFLTAASSLEGDSGFLDSFVLSGDVLFDAVHTPRDVDVHLGHVAGEAFGGGYRSWSYGQYDGTDFDQPVDESKLVMPETADELDDFACMVPFLEEARWRLRDTDCWIEAGRMSATRLVLDSLDFPDGTRFGGRRSIVRYGGAQARFESSTAAGASSTGENWSDIDFLDVNGDSYPDVVGGGRIHATLPNGSLERTARATNPSRNQYKRGDFGPRSAPLRREGTREGGATDPVVLAAVADTRFVEAGPEETDPAFGKVRKSVTEIDHDALRTTLARTDTRSDGRGPVLRTEQNALDLNAGEVGVTSHISGEHDLIDMNGDGLLDVVRATDTSRQGCEAGATGGLAVRLNLGYGFPGTYRFGAEEIWAGPASFRCQEGTLTGLPDGGGFETHAKSFGQGESSTESRVVTLRDLIDVNGDGLPDLVWKDAPVAQSEPTTRRRVQSALASAEDQVNVCFNTGASFAPPLILRGALPQPLDENRSSATNESSSFTICIQVGDMMVPDLVLGTSQYEGSGAVGLTTAFVDYNGDGYADHVHSTSDSGTSTVEVAVNAHGRTNLLRSVRRPLGGEFVLDYERMGNTQEQPTSRWALSSVASFDGVSGDGDDVRVRTLAYDEGRFDRAEREFLGFRTVTEREHDTTGVATLAGLDPASLPVFRSRFLTYLNDDVYDRGFLERELLVDADEDPYLETLNTYELVELRDGAFRPGLEDFTATRFPRLVRTDRSFHEGQATPGKTTFTTYAYDRYGNVVEFFDSGDEEAGDEIQALLEYSAEDPACLASGLTGIPTHVEVFAGGTLARKREFVVDCATGNLLEMHRSVDAATQAVTRFEYGRAGNLRRVIGPPNLKNESYELLFEYDPTGVHVAKVTDVFGLESTTEYDLRWGKPILTTDAAGATTTRTYDEFGRLETLIGPYQQASKDATVTLEYHPEAPVPYALTRNLDEFRDPADPIDTYVFTDGLGRLIQTKKDTTLHVDAGSAPVDRVLVSGRILFDFAGRITDRFYPTEEAKGGNEAFSTAFDPVQPTRNRYDVLDRLLSEELPDGTETTFRYGFGLDRDGISRFETRVTNAHGLERFVYEDVRRQTTALRESEGGSPIWTSYAYDALGQVLEVLDDHGNRTTVSYDLLGRKTSVDSPDMGLVETAHDLAGNIVEKVTPNLRAGGAGIEYEYDYNRLVAIHYPNFPENDVTYSYGAPGDPYFRAGRVVLVTDESGSAERKYGPLGEVVEEVRTVESTKGQPFESSSSRKFITFGTGGFLTPVEPPPPAYTTAYEFDTWNRLQKITYPDGEVLSYDYDSGGKVCAATAVAPSGAVYDYVRRLEYDRFEQRVFLEVQNGVQTTYEFDPVDRRLARLASYSPSGFRFQNLLFAYDDLGNVLSTENDVADPEPSDFGGPVRQDFAYDDLNRLVAASGTFDYAPSKQSRYSLGLEYDTIHNILAKNQLHELVQPSGKVNVQRKTTYDWTYDYGGAQPHAATHIDVRTYSFDANGNMTGWDHDHNGTRRTIAWDDEDQIQRISDNGHAKTYAYNDRGERVIKRGPQGETAYVNPFFTVRNGTVATKHVYVGATRIASKLSPGFAAPGGGGGEAEDPDASVFDPLRAAGEADSNPPPPSDPPDSNFLYFFHPDQLSNSAYITDDRGDLFQHVQYFPFGETWAQEKSNTQRTPYHFSGKEFDEETDLYYFGARYQDPRTSAWLAPDPIFVGYLPVSGSTAGELPGLGGVFNPKNLNAYSYAHQNPLRLRDADGRETRAEFMDRGGLRAASEGRLAQAAWWAFGRSAWEVFDFEGVNRVSATPASGRDLRGIESGTAAFETLDTGSGKPRASGTRFLLGSAAQIGPSLAKLGGRGLVSRRAENLGVLPNAALFETLHVALAAEELVNAPRAGGGLDSDPLHRAGNFLGPEQVGALLETSDVPKASVFEFLIDPGGAPLFRQFVPEAVSPGVQIQAAALIGN